MWNLKKKKRKNDGEESCASEPCGAPLSIGKFSGDWMMLRQTPSFQHSGWLIFMSCHRAGDKRMEVKSSCGGEKKSRADGFAPG